MRPLPSEILEMQRVRSGPLGSNRDFGWNGAFIVQSPFNSTLKLLISDRDGWEHVSVSVNRQDRTPTWDEMHWVKQLVWEDEETVMQLHPPQSQYVNCHPYTLHLWRPILSAIPLPPSQMVGFATIEESLTAMRKLAELPGWPKHTAS